MILFKYVFERFAIPLLYDFNHGKRTNKIIMWVRNKLLSPQMIEKYRYDSDLVDCYAGIRHENGNTWKD